MQTAADIRKLILPVGWVPSLWWQVIFCLVAFELLVILALFATEVPDKTFIFVLSLVLSTCMAITFIKCSSNLVRQVVEFAEHIDDVRLQRLRSNSNIAGLDELYRALNDVASRLSDAEREKQKMESELRDQQRALNEHAIVITTDAHGAITHVNRKFCEISQYGPEELIGQNMFFLYSDYYDENYFNGMWSAITQGEIWHDETESRRKDGQSFWVETTTVPFMDGFGRPYKYVSIRTDITARRRVEELTRANKELEQFAYIASHDLQEPLRMVSSYVQLIEKRYKGKLGADADDFIHFAVDGANRMKDLINDLLSYSRVGSRPVEYTTVDLNEVLRNVLGNLKLMIGETDAEVSNEVLPSVSGDSVQLEQLLQNLVGNAIKYHDDKPVRIHVGVEAQEGYWKITVMDNGIGIEPAYLQRIFEPFKRLHAKDEYSGSGIGLAICRKIVDRHHGEIWAESQPGTGSTFSFTLPREW